MSQYPYSNPFEAPRTTGPEPVHGTGTIDIATAVKDGWHAMLENFGPYLAMGFLFFVLATVATITVLGLFLVVPVLFWGFTRFVLKTIDGGAEVSDLFAGFNEYGKALGPMLVLFIGYLLLNLVNQAFSAGAQLIGGPVGIVMSIFGIVFGFLFMYLVARLMFAPYLIVDRDLGAVEALSQSWRSTASQQVNVILLLIVTTLISVVGVLLLLVGVIPAVMVASSAVASAYRQLTGSGPLPHAY